MWFWAGKLLQHHNLFLSSFNKDSVEMIHKGGGGPRLVGSGDLFGDFLIIV